VTSTPAPDLSNLKFRRARAEEFGYLRVANAALLCALLLVVAALSLGAWQVAKLRSAIANFKPVYIRINDVGKAEVVYYKDASYTPRAPEMIRALSDFTADFFTRMKGRTDAYWHSKYLLSQALMQRTYQDDQRSKWIDNVERGAGTQSDVTVKRVTLVSLTPKGGVAYVDLTRSYYDDGVSATRKEDDTVTYYFSFLPKVQGDLLRFNPIGICITDYSVQEDFTTK
jgi:type IV secretory pathway TrbF-like protein